MVQEVYTSGAIKAPLSGQPSGMIFTDLDGTLLDHHSYDFSPALEALNRAIASGVEVILSSSKSFPEMLQWQKRLNLNAPFITENGGGIFNNGTRLDRAAFTSSLHGFQVEILGATRLELCMRLSESAAASGVVCRGFNEMSVDEVASLTGLGQEDARMAMDRDFDEPFIILGTPGIKAMKRFKGDLEAKGCVLLRGGRFWHLMAHRGKGAAVDWLINAYAARYGSRIPSLALGDGENDISMLQAADKGVVVRKPDGSFVAQGESGLFTTSGIGPEGWRQAVEEWLQELGKESV